MVVNQILKNIRYSEHFSKRMFVKRFDCLFYLFCLVPSFIHWFLIGAKLPKWKSSRHENQIQSKCIINVINAVWNGRILICLFCFRVSIILEILEILKLYWNFFLNPGKCIVIFDALHNFVYWFLCSSSNLLGTKYQLRLLKCVGSFHLFISF